MLRSATQSTLPELAPEEFRTLGHRLVNQVADWLQAMPRGPVTPGETPAVVQECLGGAALPTQGMAAEQVLREAWHLLEKHSLFNGHPRFMGYITSSPTPIGMLGDLMAAALNPNVGAWPLSPMATEMERQTVRWIAELIGFPAAGGGILVSGGNMANIVALAAARRARAPWDVRRMGVHSAEHGRLLLYAGDQTHAWLEKGAELLGFGTDAVRRIPSDVELRMDVAQLEGQLARDRAAGDLPFFVVGTAGSVSTGAVDPLAALAELCRREQLWFHVDGAYGAPAAALPEASPDLQALALADSVAVDPHKWLYAPLEVGCVLVRRPDDLTAAFSSHPDYYRFDAAGALPPLNFYEWGPQNSRGFRALKVWLALRQIGKSGYQCLIREDIALANLLHDLVDAENDLEAGPGGLSIATLRYIGEPGMAVGDEAALNSLNERLLAALQQSGEAYLSNAVVGGRFWLRACVVNFRTRADDMRIVVKLVQRLGRQLQSEARTSAG